MNQLPQNIVTEGEKNAIFKVEGRDDCPGYLSPINIDSEYGVVMIQEWWGMNKSITITADIFAKNGFRVICPDVYRGKQAQNSEEAGHLIHGLDFEGAVKDIIGAAQHLLSIGCKKIAVTGFCMGGALVIATLARTTLFSAGCVFYGVPDLNTFKLEDVKTPILAHFAEKDEAKCFSDPETAYKLESSAKDAGLNFTLHMWKDCDHAFMNQDSVNYCSSNASLALAETAEFLSKYFA